MTQTAVPQVIRRMRFREALRSVARTTADSMGDGTRACRVNRSRTSSACGRRRLDTPLASHPTEHRSVRRRSPGRAGAHPLGGQFEHRPRGLHGSGAPPADMSRGVSEVHRPTPWRGYAHACRRLVQLPRLRCIDCRKYLSEIRPAISTITEVQRGLHRKQVLVHPFACTLCVALLEEVQKIAMIVAPLPAVTRRAVHCDDQRRPGNQLSQELCKRLIGRYRHDLHVEFTGYSNELTQITSAPGLMFLRHYTTQCSQIRRRQRDRNRVHCRTFDDTSGFENPTRLAYRGRRHACAPIARDAQQALMGETTKRLAHHGTAHSEDLRKRIFRQLGSGRDVVFDDRGADVAVYRLVPRNRFDAVHATLRRCRDRAHRTGVSRQESSRSIQIPS